MLQDKFERLPLHYAAGSGIAEACQKVGAGTLPSAMSALDALGRNVLHYAAATDRVSDCVQYFLSEASAEGK